MREAVLHQRLGPVEARVIGSLLTVNASLTSLDLYRNSIGNEGAKAIGDALRVNEALTWV